MGFEEWQKHIFHVISQIGDEGFQRSVWIKGDPNMASSFEEVACRLFDDLDFDGFLVRAKAEGFLKNEYENLEKFKIEYTKFLSKQPKIVDPKKIIEDPSWRAISRMAKSLCEKI